MKMRDVLAVSLAMLTIGGCRLFNPEESESFDGRDGNAGAVTSELVAMGECAEELMTGAAMNKSMAKSAAAQAETLYVDVVIEEWAYDEGAQCWVRKSQASFENGTRVREDTIWLMDANGDAVRTPSFNTVRQYRHVRAVGTTAGNVFDNRLDMTVQIVIAGGDTTFVKNGTITGSYNGSIYRSTTITNVKRRWRSGQIPHLAFPSEGTIDIDLPLRTIVIVFEGDGEGNGTATATATRKRDGETIVYVINVQTGAETES